MSEQGSNATPTTTRDEGPPWKLIALLVVVAAIAVFFFQNSDEAPVEFLMLDGTWPVWLVIGVSIVAGVVLDRLFSWQWRRARQRGNSEG